MEKNSSVYTSAAALITAAGSSTRMGTGRKKEYLLVQEKPVLAHTILRFIEAERFSSIMITVPPADLSAVRGMLEDYVDLTDVCFTAGGGSRQESVYRGLSALAALENGVPQYVLIHDGARPWVSPQLIQEVLRETMSCGACLPVLPAVYAMKTVDEEGFIREHLDRNHLVTAQTPQGFTFRSILDAHEQARKDGFSCFDDTELYGRYEGKVKTIPGDIHNIKITHAKDLEYQPCE